MTSLDVNLGKIRVGRLERFDDEEYCFSFDESWLRMRKRPVLGQIFEDRLPNDIITSGIPCWFAHLLPQGPLLRMIAREAGVDVDDDFDILQFLGEDLPGAVSLTPGEPRPYRDRKRFAKPAVATGAKLRFSALAGAQWKLSVHEGERGLVLPVEGGTGSWIAKFHNPEFAELPRIEYATMSWAAHSGLSVPNFRLGNASEMVDLPGGIPTGDGYIFLIERFDRRPKGERIHMEDFGQVLDRPPGNVPGGQFSLSHEHIATVLFHLAPDDVREFCERVVFCALAGNGDGHLKNWTILYPDGQHPRLSPAYDIVSTVLYPKLDDCLALDLGGSKKYEEVTENSFRLLAEVIGLNQAEVTGWVKAFAQHVRAVWRDRWDQFGFTGNEKKRIQTHLDRVPLGK